ncbi:MoaD/ThiS family protein [Paracoccaceae bacterium GXU_MW_L88]
MTLTLAPFGAFRDLPGGAIELESGANTDALRARLTDHYGPAQEALVQSAAFALNGTVIPEGGRIEEGGELALLPPVCGG